MGEGWEGGGWDSYAKSGRGWGGQVFDSAIVNYTSILAFQISGRKQAILVIPPEKMANKMLGEKDHGKY